MTDSCYNLYMSSVTYLDRFLEPVTAVLTPELARHLVELRADEELQADAAAVGPAADADAVTRRRAADGIVVCARRPA